jgi:hypothetical protein
MGIMRAFTTFLVEEPTEEKLKHLEHPEDHLIKSGETGFHHAFNTLKTTAEYLQGQESGTRLMTKYDGAPSVVFGRNPENGKFFVASKSAFNKNPKINYTAADIETNHGHAPGLVSKLKAALKYLPKVAPRVGVYQGDFLYNKADNDVSEQGKEYHFKPQLINYTAAQNSKTGRLIKNAQIGFAVHTGYAGNNLANMKANYTPDVNGFGRDPAVHLHTWNDSFNPKDAAYTDAEHARFKEHMNAAGALFKSADRGSVFNHAPEMQEHLATYVNQTVRSGTQPSVAGLQQHIQARHGRAIEAVKTEKSKAAKQASMQADLAKVKANKSNFDTMFKIHHHIQEAKNALMPALHRGDKNEYKYSILGAETGPEGFVAVTKENRPTKLIDRGAGGFANLNLQKGGFGK